MHFKYEECVWCDVCRSVRLPSGLDSLQIEQSDDEQPAQCILLYCPSVCVAVMSACHVTVTRHGPRCVTPPPRQHQSSWNEFYLFDNINNPGPASHATILPAPSASATCNDTPHIVAIVHSTQYMLLGASHQPPATMLESQSLINPVQAYKYWERILPPSCIQSKSKTFFYS